MVISGHSTGNSCTSVLEGSVDERPTQGEMTNTSSSSSKKLPISSEEIFERRAKTGASVEVPLNTSPAEVERLRTAMNAQLQLNQQRERLVWQLGDRQERVVPKHPKIGEIKSRVSPIHEMTPSPPSEEVSTSPTLFGLDSTSTESTTTSLKVGMTTPKAEEAQTPSYPFPHMRNLCPSNSRHKPFTAVSPTLNLNICECDTSRCDLQDLRSLCNSGSNSEINFQPTGAPKSKEDPIFETPNLYDLSLMLSLEPGLDPWWTTFVEILKNVYGAHRATLSVPADTTDIENVPWGQKATFSILRNAELSKMRSTQQNSNVSSHNDRQKSIISEHVSAKDDLGVPVSSRTRPGIPSRHSFTAYEDTKRDPNLDIDGNETFNSRPSVIMKANNNLPARLDFPPRTLTLQNARLNLKSLGDHLESETTLHSNSWEFVEPPDREVKGRIFSVLQALDHEADPLIDNKGISRVLKRGKVIALTRDYPYVGSSKKNERSSGKNSCRRSGSRYTCSEKVKTKSPDTTSRPSLFGHRASKSSRVSSHSQNTDYGTNFFECSRSENDQDSEQEPEYDEYEQTPASPWSQSPAPSPAVHVETSDNLFFTNMQAVDEETFNPQSTLDYCEGPQPQIIGVDRSWTVLHIPLTHPLLSKPVQSFRLDAAALESKSAGSFKKKLSKDIDDDGRPSSSPDKRAEKTPIAILSILTPLIPYPPNLRESLENLAPHLATTFSLCRHLTNLENEIAGLSRKRPSTVGFGAVVPGTFRNHIDHPLNFEQSCNSPMYDCTPHRYTTGSLTSPSDYSGLSKSNTGSPAGTPGWEPVNSSHVQDKRSSVGSPNCIFAESYFTNRSRPGMGKIDTGKIDSASNIRAWSCSKDSSSVDTRVQRLSRDKDERFSDYDASIAHLEQVTKGQIINDKNTCSEQDIRQRVVIDTTNANISDSRDHCSSHQLPDSMSHKKTSMRTASHQIPSRVDRSISMHTLLHSYGADFGSTFQPLPATTRRRTSTKPRTHSYSSPAIEPASSAYMPPPSDRVKGILLDSLPLHLFIAMPPTGEIVWVNSRYLTYRGQSIDNLHENPWGSIHPNDREAYLKSWKHSLRTGEQFAMQARLKRFDGTYRWFYTRASGLRDSRGVVVQWHGTSMDIHEQHVAEVKAARQEEIEASEAKHRRLANLIPQIIFSATEEDGITFANHQWLSFTGQPFEDSIGLGFIDFVHPEDIAKCHILIKESSRLTLPGSKKSANDSQDTSPVDNIGKSQMRSSESNVSGSTKNKRFSLSRTNSTCSNSSHDYLSTNIAELTRSGIVKVERDSNGQLSYSTEVRLRSKSGDYRWHLVRCVEVDDMNFGNCTGSWFGACADINDQKLLEMKLKEAMETKSKFLSNMSHEIRTPLIGISGMIGFLQDTILNDEQLDYCNTISFSAQGLLAIINDILDLAKADAGMIKLAYNWFHVRSLVEEVNETLSIMAITKHLELNYIVDDEVPEMVKGDRFRIRQALLNVIGNAIKFTTVGEVFTRCKISPGRGQDYKIGENEVMLEFSITDTGKGFSQEEAEIIFKPFSQIDSSTTRSQGGTGLGLVISRQLVELHGGKMEGTAILGKGSTFTFTIVCSLPTADDNPDILPNSKTNTSISSVVSESLPARTSTLSKEVKPTMGYTNLDNAGPRKHIYSSTECSPNTRSSSDSFKSFSSDSLATSILSEKSAINRHFSNSSITQLSSNNITTKKPMCATDSPQLKLEIPNQNLSISPVKNIVHEKSVPKAAPVTSLKSGSKSSLESKHTDLSVYSILLICPQKHSREATTQHIKMTLPKDVPHEIIALSSVEEAYKTYNIASLTKFTHIVLNLSLTDEIVDLIDQILGFRQAETLIVILSDPLQRQSVLEKAKNYDYEKLNKQNRITFIFKPVKPSRFAIIFDPEKERDLSTDRNRSSAEQQVATQRQCYKDIGKRLGNKGLRVLLVEDNMTNQKVLLKYLAKVRIEVDLAHDGLECTEKVFTNPHSFYSLILCDLQMPNKDGYQACREIRAWENKNNYKAMPIVALSANVMTDVADRCNEAGFSNYITKPVDFKALSKVMGDYLDPKGSVAV
ncbi:putative hsp90-like protein [Golovinomyces cichoracearum]|uniref:histidine kinase n=1 Tax=Golovinomyces cichoracearum TaxID=62708 RepID=A0A420IYD0_9PEZI|nr:putative hsp90-like protein [Golovinomyces cichoracearum]